jgi:hypothetical protein
MVSITYIVKNRQGLGRDASESLLCDIFPKGVGPPPYGMPHRMISVFPFSPLASSSRIS